MDPTTFNRLEFPAVLSQVAALAQSAAARRAIEATTPWTDLETIHRHWDAVEEVLGLLDTGGALPIARFDDCEELLARLAMPNGILDPGEWLRMRGFLETGARVRRQIKDACARMPVCWQRIERLDALPELTARIGRVFDADGLVRDSASAELRDCRRRIKNVQREIEKVFLRILAKFQDGKVLQEAYWTERGERRVLPVRAGARGRLPGIVHDTSNSGETLFVEPFEAVEPTNRLAEERTREREEILRVLAALSAEARGDLPELEWNREALVELDQWHARAQLAHRHGLHRPQIHPDYCIDLIEAHHPLLFFKDRKSSVPLSMRLEPENRALVITGPNTGGKTTSLKTIGLIALMAQSAIPVPAAVDSRLPLFEQVLAEVGDEQSVSAGLSTFSAHIRRISRILEVCGSGALVLLDELGKATDPLQAGALGRAILEALIERGALTLVTTHLGTLKDWAHESPAGRNASYRLDPTTHRPLYRIHLDTPGISEAFTIARAEGLPAHIVEAAIEQLPKEERDMTELLATLHAREARLAEQLREAEAARANAERESERLGNERAALQQKKLEADRCLEKDYKEMLDRARADVEKRIAALPSRKALSETREELARDQRQAERRLEAFQERERAILKASGAPAPRAELPYEATVGDWVYVGMSGQAGRIEKINTARRHATLSVGGVSVQAPLAQLRPAPAQPEVSAPRFSHLRYQSGVSVQTVEPEIDLHGQRVEPALENLDKYLDRAILAHLNRVRVVHGHGTGALRTAVHEALRAHPLVSHFRIADLREGGPAATLVTLK